ncbi:MAG: TetR/AcrR family transcriptional regulator [Methanomassiliicoccus sp.]|nr:TetR/AcrR family transcriptional regulator [Methanomassiliicoccus sp.]
MNKNIHGLGSYQEKTAVKGKREQILDAALHCFITQGFHATPTAQISREANVSTGTLFHYFPDKNTLIDQLYLSISKEMKETIPTNDDRSLSPAKRINDWMKRYIKWCVANPEKALFLDQFCQSPDISDVANRQNEEEEAWLLEAFDEAKKKGLIRDLPDEFYEMMTTQIVKGIIELINSGATNLSEDELIDVGLEMLWRK